MQFFGTVRCLFIHPVDPCLPFVKRAQQGLLKGPYRTLNLVFNIDIAEQICTVSLEFCNPHCRKLSKKLRNYYTSILKSLDMHLLENNFHMTFLFDLLF